MIAGFDWQAVSTFGFSVIMAILLLERGFQVLREQEQTQQKTARAITEAIGALNMTVASFQSEVRATLAEIRRLAAARGLESGGGNNE